MIVERNPPTFWSHGPDDEKRVTVAARELKELVVRLSETILRYVEGRR